MSGIGLSWTSRDNRKGRHALVLGAEDLRGGKYILPPYSYQSKANSAKNRLRAAVYGTSRMFTHYPYWDISYLVAVIFTLGSVVWVFNGFFVFLPIVAPKSTFTGEVADGGGITAFLGATIFEIGSILLILEAINADQQTCFGWAVENLAHSLSKDREDNETQEAKHYSSETSGKVLERSEKGSASALRLFPDHDHCHHHHMRLSRANRSRDYANTTENKNTDIENRPSARAALDSNSASRSWSWYPTISELRSNLLPNLGFLASFAQLMGASVFWISGFTALPGIYNHLSHPLINGVYWTPQAIGGSFFIISGLLFAIETQSCWYIPGFKVLGWHIAAWNTIGGLGFALSPIFGYFTASWGEYQAACSTFWGSWAFLIGSLLQWYESLDKYPIVIRNTAIQPSSEPLSSDSDDATTKV